MKKNISVLFFLAFILFILTGCPYSSTVPIDEPRVKVSKKMLGKWIKESEKESENPSFYEFKKLDNLHYTVDENEYNTTDSAYEVTSYMAHFSEIDNIIFINMKRDDSYFLYKLEFNGKDEFLLFEVTDNIDETFTTSAELKAFMKKYMYLSFFYNKDEVKYIKADEF